MLQRVTDVNYLYQKSIQAQAMVSSPITGKVIAGRRPRCLDGDAGLVQEIQCVGLIFGWLRDG
jgi:hypothetical protein